MLTYEWNKQSLWHTFLAAISWAAHSTPDKLWHFYSEYLHCYQHFNSTDWKCLWAVFRHTYKWCVQLSNTNRNDAFQIHSQYQIAKTKNRGFRFRTKKMGWTRCEFQWHFRVAPRNNMLPVAQIAIRSDPQTIYRNYKKSHNNCKTSSKNYYKQYEIMNRVLNDVSSDECRKLHGQFFPRD